MSQRGISVSTFIPESIGGQDILFENAPLVGTIEFFDGVLIFFPAFIFLMFGDLVLPTFLEPYTMFVAVLIALTGMMALVVKPNHLTLQQWINIWRDFRDREKDLSKHYTGDDGKPFESIEVVPDDDTRKLTKVERVYPERDVVELEDGTMISILEFSGSNLDMASNNLLLGTVDQYARTVSSQLRDDIQFYMPMRPVSTEATARVYEKQIENLHIEDSRDEFLDAYLQDRVNWVRGLADSTFIREQYVVVPVNRHEVHRQKMATSKSGLEKLPAGDIIRDIKMGLTGEAQMQSVAEVRRQQLREIEQRRNTIGGILAQGPGNSFNVAPTEKSVALIKEFWEGNKILSDEMDSMSNDYEVSVSPDDRLPEEAE